MFHLAKPRPESDSQPIVASPLPGEGTRGEESINHDSSPIAGPLSRRQLLKLGTAGVGMMAASTLAARAALAEDLISGGRSVSRTTGTVRRSTASTCTQCAARCGILGFVDENKLVKLEGNPRDPNSRGRLCARGQAGINRLYDPDRLLFPMERVGRRGENRWVRLSWSQAYDVLQQRLGDAQARNPESLVLHSGAEGLPLLAGRFVAALGSRTLLDEAALHNANRTMANRLTMGAEIEVVDVIRARYVLNFGGNPYETHPAYLPFVQRLVDARMNGARLVTFDPRLSMTAGRSDDWFPIAPGSDAVVALAMANVIVQQGLHDRQFLARWTDLPPDQLGAALAPYTPQAAEAASGIRADELRRVATEFARVRPAVAIFGGGVGHQSGAVDTQRAVLLLNAVVGSFGAPGGYCPSQTVSLPEPDPVPSPLPDSAEALRVVDGLIQGKGSAAVYVTSMANPAYSWPNPGAFASLLKDENRVAYLVSIDTNLTETSMLADLVLPAATYLESWGLDSPASQELIPQVSLRQPIVPARGESLSVDDILLTLGTRLTDKSAQFFPFPTMESYVNAVVSKLPGLAGAGGLPVLKEHGLWYDPSAAPQYRAGSEGFATQSGKLEFAPVFAGKNLNQTATAAGTDHSQLTLVTYRPNVHFGDYTANSWWLSEIAHSNVLLINPEAAHERGIKQGHQVKITSATGSVEAKARITQGIHPQVVALASGFGHQALGRVARAQLFKSDDPMTMHVWWASQGNGANASVLLSGNTRESSGGLVWMNTTVKIEAVG